jgi:hypothetical protein
VAGHQALHQDLSRSAEQDQIEARMESDWVLLTSSDEQQVGVFGSQELADGVLAPPLASIPQRLAPSVGVDGLIPASSQRWATLNFPVLDIPVRTCASQPRAYEFPTVTTSQNARLGAFSIAAGMEPIPAPNGGTARGYPLDI